MKKALVVLLVLCVTSLASAATVAFWNFEDGVAGQAFTPAGAANGSGGSADVVAGYMMNGWDSYYGPGWTSSSTPDGSSLAMKNADNHQDGYCWNSAITNWSPSTWTIECSVLMEEISGWETIIGRDGSSQSELESDFYLSNNGIDDKFRINIDTVGGQRWIWMATMRSKQIDGMVWLQSATESLFHCGWTTVQVIR